MRAREKRLTMGRMAIRTNKSLPSKSEKKTKADPRILVDSFIFYSSKSKICLLI